MKNAVDGDDYDDDDDDDDNDDEYFCGFDRREIFGLVSSREHCQRSSSPRISDMLQAG